ncbi:hypothetical protein M2271_000431 [Streptomyces sp. LBL]|nr:hypothetical protein [Streptomyces sp. LBL]
MLDVLVARFRSASGDTDRVRGPGTWGRVPSRRRGSEAALAALARINACFARWIRQKYKRLAAEGPCEVQEITRGHSRMFAHWRHVTVAMRV